MSSKASLILTFPSQVPPSFRGKLLSLYAVSTATGLPALPIIIGLSVF